MQPTQQLITRAEQRQRQRQKTMHLTERTKIPVPGWFRREAIPVAAPKKSPRPFSELELILGIDMMELKDCSSEDGSSVDATSHYSTTTESSAPELELDLSKKLYTLNTMAKPSQDTPAIPLEWLEKSPMYDSFTEFIAWPQWHEANKSTGLHKSASDSKLLPERDPKGVKRMQKLRGTMSHPPLKYLPHNENPRQRGNQKG